MLKAVIFDYGGVLRGDDRELWRAVDAGVGLPSGTLWAAWHDIPEYRLSRSGVIDGLAFRAAIRRALIPAAGSAERADAAMAALDARLADLPVIDLAMRALVDRLRAAGRVKLGLLSNASRGFTDRLQQLGVAALFDDVIGSGDVGLAKPDPAIFRLAAERLAFATSECLMIDDQLQHIEGARAAGLRAHHHEPARLGELIAQLEKEGALS